MLGEGGEDGDSAPKTALERYDLAKRTCEEITTGLDWVDVSGDGKRLVILSVAATCRSWRPTGPTTAAATTPRSTWPGCA